MNSSTNSLSNAKYEMCRLPVDQFISVFTIPDPQQITTGPVSISSLRVNRATELAPVLSIIFIILSDGVIPKSWKRVDIIPIYISGDKTVTSNYRPISLTSVTCPRKNYYKIIFSFLD